MTISNTVFYFLWLLEHNRVGTPTAARGHYALIEAAGNSYGKTSYWLRGMTKDDKDA